MRRVVRFLWTSKARSTLHARVGQRLTAAAVSAFAPRKRPSPAYAIRSCLSQSWLIGYCAYDAMNHIVDPFVLV
jgi:hypothetical protein